MFEFTHNEDLIEKGQWMASLDNALISCPTCGKFGSLGNHEVAPDGTVSPSLVCPWKPCLFHDSGRLKDWKP